MKWSLLSSIKELLRNSWTIYPIQLISRYISDPLSRQIAVAGFLVVQKDFAII